MLVLVLTILGSCLGRFWKASTSLVITLLCVSPSIGLAQSDADSDPDTEADIQKSVLVVDGGAEANPVTLISGINGIPGIDEQSEPTPNATQTMSPAPSPPQLLIPKSPTHDSSTVPMVNELRGDHISSESITTAKAPETEAVGTFATTNQARQGQQTGFAHDQLGGQTPTFDSQNQNGVNFQHSNHFQQSNNLQQTNNFQQPNNLHQQAGSDNSFGGGAITGGMPPIGSASQSATAGSSMQDTPRVSSKWRDAPSVPAGSQIIAGSHIGSPQTSLNNIGQSVGKPVEGNSATAHLQGNSIQSGFDSQSVVQPTGFNQPIQRSQSNVELAKTLIARYALGNFSGTLPGEPIKLVEILRQPISTQQRRPLVHRYWETYYDWATLVASQQYEQWLNRVPVASSQADKSMLEAARVVARNKVLAAEIQLGKSQSGLMQYLTNRGSDFLPLPNDLPLIQKYKTNYELYRSHRLMPTSLRGIDQVLPKTLDLIGKRAEAVRVANLAADQMIAGLSRRQTTLATALEAGRIWRAAEQDLVASVTSYNQAIADYSLTVSQGYQTPEQIVAMLIAKPTNKVNNGQAFQDKAKNQSAGQVLSVGDNRFANQPQNQIQSSGGRQASFGGQQINFGRQSNAGVQQSRFSNDNLAGGFKFNANNSLPPNAQSNTGVNASSAQRQSVSGQFIAPATPVGNPSSTGFGSFGPKLPPQKSVGQGVSSRAAQTPFGPGTSGFGR